MLGREALMRLSLVISFPPGASGTLKSTLMKTRFPSSERSRIDNVLMALSCQNERVAAGGGVGHFVAEADHARVGFLEPGFDQDLFVVAGGGVVAAMGLHHNQKDALIALQIAVADTLGAEILDAANFHPDDVVGVVDDSHLIGLGIADAKLAGDRLHDPSV